MRHDLFPFKLYRKEKEKLAKKWQKNGGKTEK